MPSLVTHCLAAHKMIPTNCYVEACISKNMYAFNIGSSGPDLFYFYHAFPWSNKEGKDRIYALGEVFHNTKANDHFKCAMEYAKNSKDETIVAYMAGWLCHYALDRNCHPYIFHKTGDDSYAHRRMEADIDCAMLAKLLNTSIKNYKPYEIINNDEHTRHAIFQIYEHVLKEVYGITLEEHIVHESIKDMRFSYRLLHDPNNIKRSLIKKIESVPYQFTGTMIPSTVNTNEDILNLEHSEWCNPCDNTIKSNEDFLQLFDKGVQDGLLLLTLFNNYVNGNLSIDVILKQINNVDYCTGLPFHPAMKFYNPIYK